LKILDIAACALCVSVVSTGQVLLRAASVSAAADPSLGWRAWLNGTSILAGLVYGTAMLLWLWILGRVPLTQAFAWFGMSFFLVPLLAHRFLGDPVSPYPWVGAGIILLGILVSGYGAD
jgi:undecaprenyl phosphate-alpha-L-ara4N flippase subunit ArnE